MNAPVRELCEQFCYWIECNVKAKEAICIPGVSDWMTTKMLARWGTRRTRVT